MELLDRFFTWLSEGADKETAHTKRPLLAAPKIPKQITEHTPPSPQHLADIAVAYRAKQLETSNDQYEAFFRSGYPNFVQWAESQAERSAAFGGQLLLLTFDNSTGIVTAATRGIHASVTPHSYPLPLSQSAVHRLAIAVAEHFHRAEFTVRLTHVENTFSRTGVQTTTSCDNLDIIWSEAIEEQFA